MSEIIQQEWFGSFVVPVLICLARIMDVSIGTFRVICVSKGIRTLAPILGFFEILIWISVLTEIMKNLDNFQNIVAYALGFALGNYIGITIDNKFAIGSVTMRVITKRNNSELVKVLRQQKYNVVTADAEADSGHISLIFLTIKRSQIKQTADLIYKYNPYATYTVEDIRAVSDNELNDAGRGKKFNIFSQAFSAKRK